MSKKRDYSPRYHEHKFRLIITSAFNFFILAMIIGLMHGELSEKVSHLPHFPILILIVTLLVNVAAIKI
jgi:hypothetical protein